MARAHLVVQATKAGGAPLSNGTVTVYEDKTTTLIVATMYKADGTVQANPITTGSDGRADIYLDVGQLVNLKISGPGMVDVTLASVAVPDDPATAVRVGGTQTVTGAKTFNGLVANNPVLNNPVINSAILMADGPVLARNLDPTTALSFGANYINMAVAGVEIARAQARGLIGKLIDDGGLIWTMDSRGADNTGATSCSTILDTLLAQAAAAGGGTVMFLRGTYKLTKRHLVPSNVTIAGLGVGVTTIKRAFNASDWIFNCNNATGAHVNFRDFTFDGDYPNNPKQRATEITLDGTDNWAYRVRFVNCRMSAISADGLRPSILFCEFEGPGIGAWTDDGGVGVAPTQGIFYQGIDGYSGATRGTLILGNRFNLIASPPMFLPGSDGSVVDNYMSNSHLHSSTTGGGNIGWAAPGGVKPTNWLFAMNTVVGPAGPLTTDHGPRMSGVEADYIDGLTIFGNTFDTLGYVGVFVSNAQRVQILCNTFKNCGQGATGTADYPDCAILISGGTTRNVEGILVLGNHCYDDQASKTQKWGIFTAIDSAGTGWKNDYLTIMANDCRGNFNAAGISLNGSGTNKHCLANWPASAPSVLASGLSLAGQLVAANSTNPGVFNATAATGTLRPLLAGQVSGVNKWFIGFDTDDTFALLSNNAGASNFRVDNSGNTTVRGDLAVSGLIYTTPATAPTLTQGGAALGITVNYARYKALGKWAHVQVQVTVTDVTNAVADNVIKLNLPSSNPNLSSARTGDVAVVGAASYFETSIGWKSGNAVAKTATAIQFARNDKADFYGSVSDRCHVSGGGTLNKAQVNDVFAVDLVYELA